MKVTFDPSAEQCKDTDSSPAQMYDPDVLLVSVTAEIPAAIYNSHCYCESEQKVDINLLNMIQINEASKNLTGIREMCVC